MHNQNNGFKIDFGSLTGAVVTDDNALVGQAITGKMRSLTKSSSNLIISLIVITILLVSSFALPLLRTPTLEEDENIREAYTVLEELVNEKKLSFT